MIAPPNQGSYLAQYACSLDLWEYCTSSARRRESGIIAGSVFDGFSEATRDLQPESRFLRTLNQRSRNPRVRYSLVIGTAGPLRPNDFASVDRLLCAAGRRCSWIACTQRQFRQRILAADELFAGKGDGLVAVETRGWMALTMSCSASSPTAPFLTTWTMSKSDVCGTQSFSVFEFRSSPSQVGLARATGRCRPSLGTDCPSASCGSQWDRVTGVVRGRRALSREERN